ncbi:MAG: shikimate kinase [Caulobacterales bacterium]|nr:shikimate kinase [Caulobacterales bacterium]
MDDDKDITGRTIALVGLMGVGKSSVGRRLALALSMPFVDADTEIEVAARRSVADIFSDLGEAEFRSGEHRVIRRIVEGPPTVLATGGGAFVHDGTRALLKSKAVTVWLQADLDVLVERATRRDTRPLLRGQDPREVLARLAEARYPLYAEADVHVMTGEGAHRDSVRAVIAGIQAYYSGKAE